MCSRHAATGSGSSRRVQKRDRLPEPLDVRLAEHLVRPAHVRIGDSRPVDAPGDHVAADDLRDLLHLRPPDALTVEVAEELRLGVAGGRDHRRAVQ